MFQHITVVAAVIATLLGAGPAAAEIRIREQAIETSTAVTSVPDDAAGSIVVKACPSCSPLLLRLTPRSRFRVGRTEVSYDEFRTLAREASARGLGVFYDAKQRTITRLILSGELPARRAR